MNSNFYDDEGYCKNCGTIVTHYEKLKKYVCFGCGIEEEERKNKVFLAKLQEEIKEKSREIEPFILRNKSKGRNHRRRVRSREEKDLLNLICYEKINKALEDGTIKIISERKWELVLDE